MSIYNALPNDIRSTVFPIVRKDLYAHYNAQKAMFWSNSNIPDIKDDIPIFKMYKPADQALFKGILIFFEYADNLAGIIFGGPLYLGEMSGIPEIKLIMDYQTMMEDIHAIQYSLLSEEYMPDPLERESYRRQLDNSPFIKKIIDWVSKSISRDNVPQNIFIMSMFEGVLFTGAFAIIFSANELTALRVINEYIAKDEGKHHISSKLLTDMLKPETRLKQAEVDKLTREFMEFVCDFMVDITPMSGFRKINKQNIVQYVKYMADSNLILLGYNSIYKVTNPYKDWMKNYSVAAVNSPHERHGTNYSAIDPEAAILTTPIANLFDKNPKKPRIL